MMAGKVGSIETVIRAINAHVHNTELCGNGCAALIGMMTLNSKKHTKSDGTNKQ